MKPVVVGLLLALIGVGPAFAADLPVPAPIPPANYYPAAAPFNWSGIYIGINGGYGFGSSVWTNAGVSTGNFNTNGALLGGTLGINYAGFGGGFLFGVEGDIDWSTVRGNSSVAACTALGPVVPPGTACATGNNWLSTARVRTRLCVRPPPGFWHGRRGHRCHPGGLESAGNLLHRSAPAWLDRRRWH